MPSDAGSDLEGLLDRLKTEQHALIDEAARGTSLPPNSLLREIADYENTIAAVIALIEEREG